MTSEEGKCALITGITGQDGCSLAELLLGKGYEVHSVIRRASTCNTELLDHFYAHPHEFPALHLPYEDLGEGRVIRQILERYEPLEIHDLGARAHLRASDSQPESTEDAGRLGTLRVPAVVREYGIRSSVRDKVCRAGSPEMLGAEPPPQNEQRPFHPRGPYAVIEHATHWYVRTYCAAYGLFISTGMRFNHEAQRRAERFATRKLSRVNKQNPSTITADGALWQPRPMPRLETGRRLRRCDTADAAAGSTQQL